MHERREEKDRKEVREVQNLCSWTYLALNHLSKSIYTAEAVIRMIISYAATAQRSLVCKHDFFTHWRSWKL